MRKHQVVHASRKVMRIGVGRQPKKVDKSCQDGDAAPAATIEMGTKFWGISSAGRASDLHSEGHRFDPVILHHFARIAHQVEQLICNHQVVGSSPAAGTSLVCKSKWLRHSPVTREITGSIPVQIANK